MQTTTKNKTPIYRAAPTETDDQDHDAEAMIMFSARMTRVDYDSRMFRIEISADVAGGPEELPEQIGRLVAYRLHTPWMECTLEDGEIADYFDTFDAMSADACAAIEDLIAVQDRVKKKLARSPSDCPPENLVYVDQIFVEKEFRGRGLARSMMSELHDHLVGAPALVFLQAIPFLSAVSAPRETRAWELERKDATKAMARHWLAAPGLNFFQPGPRTHPQMLVAAWDGGSLDDMAERCHFIPLERIEPDAFPDAFGFGITLKTNTAAPGQGQFAKSDASQTSEIDPARSQDIYDLSDVEKCRLAAEDLGGNVLFRGEIDEIVAVSATVYAALRDGDDITAVVLVPKMTDGGNLYFRAIEEELGPLACTAPLSFLARLTPPRNELAEKWRKDCWRQAQPSRQSA